MDISADLTELGRTPVAVVCAGAKSVLDIPRTLEFLETQVGVLVMPANWRAGSGKRNDSCCGSFVARQQLRTAKLCVVRHEVPAAEPCWS
jgi:hypothetical protein